METIGTFRVNLVNPKVDEECKAEFVVAVGTVRFENK